MGWKREGCTCVTSGLNRPRYKTSAGGKTAADFRAAATKRAAGAGGGACMPFGAIVHTRLHPRACERVRLSPVGGWLGAAAPGGGSQDRAQEWVGRRSG